MVLHVENENAVTCPEIFAVLSDHMPPLEANDCATADRWDCNIASKTVSIHSLL